MTGKYVTRSQADKMIGRVRMIDRIGIGIETGLSALLISGSAFYALSNRPFEAGATLLGAAVPATLAYIIYRMDKGIAKAYRDNSEEFLRENYQMNLI
jgi:hypothetical protein